MKDKTQYIKLNFTENFSKVLVASAIMHVSIAIMGINTIQDGGGMKSDEVI